MTVVQVLGYTAAAKTRGGWPRAELHHLCGQGFCAFGMARRVDKPQRRE
jgi:hypothetical protein